MSLDSAPWPPDVTPRITAASSVPIVVRLRLVGMFSSVNDVPFETLDITEDAARRPFGVCTAVLPRRVFDVSGFNAAGFAQGATWLHVFAHYAGDPDSDALRIFAGPVLLVHDTGTAVRIEAHTLDALLAYDYTGQGQVPNKATDAAAAMRGLLIQPRTLPYYLDLARPPVADANTLAQIRASWLNPFDNVADYAAGLVDCYPNAWTFPSRAGTQITIQERPPAPVAATSLDCRPGSGLVLAPPAVDYSPADWGNSIRFTSEWVDDVGADASASRWYNELGGVPAQYRERMLIQTVDVRRRWRPPNDDLYASPVPVRVLRRIAARTWTATVQAKPLLWVRPGVPVRVRDALLGIVQVVRFTFPGSLMVLTVRPS